MSRHVSLQRWSLVLAAAGAFSAMSSAMAGTGAAVTTASSAAGIVHLDLDEPGAVRLEAGCGGALDDWEAVRSVSDPTNGSVRSLGAGTESCLVLPGAAAKDVVLSARMTSDEGPAGFAARYRSPGEYLEIAVDLGAGEAVARQHTGGAHQSLGSIKFPPIHEGTHDLQATVAGDEVAISLDGRKVYKMSGIDETAGRVALYARRGALVEFDDVDVVPILNTAAPVLEPLTPLSVMVGHPIDRALRCHSAVDPDESGGGCRFSAAAGALPPGITMTPEGRLHGAPESPGVWLIDVAVTGPRGVSDRYPLRLRARASSWPRFPFEPGSRVERDLAVLYTPDDLGPWATLQSLGSPDQILFRLHKAHPALKVAVMGCPDNRYDAVGRTLEKLPEAQRVWKRLATDPALDWLELGGHGYTHSPEGDTNLDHHEFSTTQTGCNIDHTKLGEADYCRRHMSLAREALRTAGIPDDRVVVMRFPGVSDSPEALRAAADAGFEAILGNRHSDEAGREWWIAHPGGEMLEIENSNLTRCFSRSPELEKALQSGKLQPADVAGDPRFTSEVGRGSDYVEQVVAQGGILNLFDHWWETFAMFGGVTPRYLVLDAVLDGIEQRYGPRAWYPHARDLALWLQTRRFSTVTWRRVRHGLMIGVDPPERWRARGLSGLETASIVVGLPPAFGVTRVEISEGKRRWRALGEDRWWSTNDGLAVTFPFHQSIRLRIR